MGSSFQHHPLHLMYVVLAPCCECCRGLQEGSSLEVSPQSEPKVSLSQELAEDPGSSVMALG